MSTVVTYPPRERLHLQCGHGPYYINQEGQGVLESLRGQKSKFCVSVVCGDCKAETVHQLSTSRGIYQTKTSFLYKESYGHVNRTRLPDLGKYNRE
jgi:hypothetical protein